MKSKGFTLVELLAVVVILAVLVLMAIPTISSIMTKSLKSVFSSEAKVIMNSYYMAYSDKSQQMVYDVSYVRQMNNFDDSKPEFFDNYDENTKNYKSLKRFVKQKIRVGGKERKCKVLCMTLQDLVDDGYLDKSLGHYTGHVTSYTTDDNIILYSIHITDGINLYTSYFGKEIYFEEIKTTDHPLTDFNSCYVPDNHRVFNYDTSVVNYGGKVPKM